MTVEVIEAWVPMSIEDIIDAGLATPDILAEYDAMQAARRARWDALPWHRRIWLSLVLRVARWRA